MQDALLAALSASALSAGMLAWLARTRVAGALQDRPNHRSLHEAPVPRIGGIAMALAVSLVLLAWPAPGVAGPLALALGLALLSLLDDRAHLPTLLRLAAHLAAAVAAVAVLPAGIGWPVAFAAVLGIAWMTNLFNFMDGANGLAGGMSVAGFGAYAVAAGEAHAGIAVASAALAGAALGFLCHNLPGRVFMGDAGSIPLGFLAASLNLAGWQAGCWPWWFGVLAFSPFVADATITLAKRALRGERVWMAHREHYYQRLVLHGWSHSRTAATYYILMLASAISALAARDDRLAGPVVTCWVITYLVLPLWLEWRFHQDNKDKTEQDPGAT